MKNLKQLVLPMLQIGDGNVRGGMVLPAREHGRNMQPHLSPFPLSKMAVSEAQNTKRGLGYAVHPGQVDRSMLVLAKEWASGARRCPACWRISRNAD